jgi:hypothetical protein
MTLFGENAMNRAPMRTGRGKGWTGLALIFLAAGCTSPGPATSWPWPWQQATATNEEFRIPPDEDTRYSEPQKFPKSVMSPSIRQATAPDTRRPSSAGIGAPGLPTSRGSLSR